MRASSESDFFVVGCLAGVDNAEEAFVVTILRLLFEVPPGVLILTDSSRRARSSMSKLRSVMAVVMLRTVRLTESSVGALNGERPSLSSLTLTLSVSTYCSSCSSLFRTAFASAVRHDLLALRKQGEAHLDGETDLFLVLEVFRSELTNADHFGVDRVVTSTQKSRSFFSLRFRCLLVQLLRLSMGNSRRADL